MARSAPVKGPPQPAPTPDPSAGVHDWENPGPAPRFEEQSFHANQITSSRTLDQTAKWMRWAILQCGEPEDNVNHARIIDVSFDGCSMEWTERHRISDGPNATVSER